FRATDARGCRSRFASGVQHRYAMNHADVIAAAHPTQGECCRRADSCKSLRYNRRGPQLCFLSLTMSEQPAPGARQAVDFAPLFAETSSHTPATFQENTGFRLNGFPSLGSWLSYGLGSETDNLPAFVVIPDARGQPAGGPINWSNGFLSARHQGVALRSQGQP